MSLMNPVISDLIVAAYEQERRAEVEKVRVRSKAPRGVDRTGRMHPAHSVAILGALKRFHAGRGSRPEVAVPTGGRVLVPAGSGSDGRLC